MQSYNQDLNVRKEVICSSCGKHRVMSVTEMIDDGWSRNFDGLVCPQCSSSFRGVPDEYPAPLSPREQLMISDIKRSVDRYAVPWWCGVIRNDGGDCQMRPIDADKMLEAMENGTSPLYGYVPKDWILSQPTVSPSEYQLIDIQQVGQLVESLLDHKWETTVRDYSYDLDHPDAYKTKYPKDYEDFQYLIEAGSSSFIDPKEFRSVISGIRWYHMKDPDTSELLIKSPEFVELVNLAFPGWDRTNRKYALTDMCED